MPLRLFLLRATCDTVAHPVWHILQVVTLILVTLTKSADARQCQLLGIYDSAFFEDSLRFLLLRTTLAEIAVYQMEDAHKLVSPEIRIYHLTHL